MGNRLKYTDGFTRPLPWTLTAVSIVVSVVLLGIWLLGDPATTSRIAFKADIVAGIAGLTLTA